MCLLEQHETELLKLASAEEIGAAPNINWNFKTAMFVVYCAPCKLFTWSCGNTICEEHKEHNHNAMHKKCSWGLPTF